MRNRPVLLAVLVAGVVAVLTYSLPNKLGLILAALAGWPPGCLPKRATPNRSRRALPLKAPRGTGGRPVNEVGIIAGMALVTLGGALSAAGAARQIPRPERIFRALKYVPSVVLTAIIVPAVLFKDERLTLSPTNDYLVAGIISVFVAWRSKNLLLTIVIGMAVFLGWRWVLSTHLLGL